MLNLKRNRFDSLKRGFEMNYEHPEKILTFYRDNGRSISGMIKHAEPERGDSASQA